MYDSKYDSKMHDITIPLMGFKNFHHAGNSEFRKDFEGFIGRESIIDKLRSWLEDNNFENERDDSEDKIKSYSKRYSGAYLITGFRGMGKSAFVHKAIREIKEKAQKDKKNSCYYVPISINVGNDLLTSKELLYIICKLLSANFDEKTRWVHNKRSIWNLLWAQIPCLIMGLTFAIVTIYLKGCSHDSSHYLLTLCAAALFIICCILMRYVFYYLWKRTGHTYFITTWQIKRAFKHINERIDSEMTISSDQEVKQDSSALSDMGLPNIGYKLKKSKKNVYPIAQTSEIQDLLVSQLHLIRRLKYAQFRFIFVIDELDKVSPEDDEKQIVPEYNSASVINGNSTYSSRQRAFVGLLANMKYFISSSEAKFIFITGYDMYEATLADISNREFNIHSIFNGYINVSSFLRKTGKSKGADSMIEKYLCNLLFKTPDNQEYKRDDLGDYAHYLRDIQNDYCKFERFDMLLDRRIIFLRHFLTYLFYMSNGSPKKLAMYLEKYVRSKKRVVEQIEAKVKKSEIKQEYDEISLGIDEIWCDCDFFLYFDERSIYKIEFINYLIYPMIKNLIAKSSIYNDKLLVSTSFMISNLYKFHKSGFSWRNLEYLPELLDINKTPELRDFIGGIMQFLNQTHIDEAAINLYKFKFPQRLSEEITYFSKTAEEISYLFNFSHDELLSIKKLYHQQLENYRNPAFESPALASIHHMLGDIYMLEENYEQAIFEFNEALNAISRQDKDNPKNEEDSSNFLFRMRVGLKLGLAYEKRKTFDTAYITYENLVSLIVDSARKARPLESSNPEANIFNIVSCLKSTSSFYSNIRLTYLAILAKASVLEKMDLGGISALDLIKLLQEFEPIRNKLNHEIKPVVVTDFYTKLGVILFFKNGNYSCNNNDEFINKVLVKFRKRLGLDSFLRDKFDECQRFLNQRTVNENRVNAPCMACQCFNASLKNCMDDLGASPDSFDNKSRSLFFLQHLYDAKYSQEIVKKGNIFLLTTANALVGMANTLLGCIKDADIDISLLFTRLKQVFDNGFANQNIDINAIHGIRMNHFAKSLIYYLTAAKTYELLTDYKSAYNIYIQTLDAVWVYYKAQKKEVESNALDFCEKVTERAIECAYLHYDSINCAEIDTQKHEMSVSPSSKINLHSLSMFPEIEVVGEKFYQLCLIGSDNQRKNEMLKTVLNSRQIGRYRLVATLTQNIQNLYFKVLVDEEMLSTLLPDLNISLRIGNIDLMETFTTVCKYFIGTNSGDVDKFCTDLKWDILSTENNEDDRRFNLLDFLIKDMLYCLDKIVELVAPLFSTTLYNNTFIGEIYEKAYNWSFLLVCIRDIFEYAEAKPDKTSALLDEFRQQYGATDMHVKTLELACQSLKKSIFWKEFPRKDGQTRMESLYEHIDSDNNNYQSNSYLLGNAIDYFNRAIEMHSSGKAYKEMMPTLFFLEDDLLNDSNYLNTALERFLLNKNYVQDKLDGLRHFTFAKNTKSRLLIINNYFKP